MAPRRRSLAARKMRQAVVPDGSLALPRVGAESPPCSDARARCGERSQPAQRLLPSERVCRQPTGWVPPCEGDSPMFPPCGCASRSSCPSAASARSLTSPASFARCLATPAAYDRAMTTSCASPAERACVAIDCEGATRPSLELEVHIGQDYRSTAGRRIWRLTSPTRSVRTRLSTKRHCPSRRAKRS